jgi:hypothetical protein
MLRIIPAVFFFVFLVGLQLEVIVLNKLPKWPVLLPLSYEFELLLPFSVYIGCQKQLLISWVPLCFWRWKTFLQRKWFFFVFLVFFICVDIKNKFFKIKKIWCIYKQKILRKSIAALNISWTILNCILCQSQELSLSLIFAI